MARRRRRRGSDYAGALGRLTLADALELDASAWRAQRKIDGQYAVALLDERGAVAEVISRSGRPVGEGVHHLRGEVVGPAWSVLVGELEASTEAGIRAARANVDALPTLHLFDALQIGQRDLRREPYRTRRDLLYRAHAELADRDRDQGWYPDRHGHGHDSATGDYCRRVRRGWRRTRIVEEMPLSALEREYERARFEADVEGLVLVAQAAPVGKTKCKLKLKPSDTIDAVVVERAGRRCRLMPRGMTLEVERDGRRVVGASAPLCFWLAAGRHEPAVGQVWEVASDGFYDSGVPKFPRLIRAR